MNTTTDHVIEVYSEEPYIDHSFELQGETYYVAVVEVRVSNHGRETDKPITFSSTSKEEALQKASKVEVGYTRQV
jgi:hypothetical protein